ncbi:MAG: CBS domain-containing protein [Candidatus Omnitrophica bacterium]|nr:CBS domain-containing protein [Candidatus Omnitrophota bacterium]
MSENEQRIAQIRSLFNDITLRAIMVSPVITINVDANLSEALESFIAYNITHLIVVDSQIKLKGIITQKYIYKTCSPRKIMGDISGYDPDLLLDGDSVYSKQTLDNFILRHMMKKNPFVLTPDDSIASAVCYMAKNNIACIPLVNDKEAVCGIITNQEIVNFISQFV